MVFGHGTMISVIMAYEKKICPIIPTIKIPLLMFHLIAFPKVQTCVVPVVLADTHPDSCLAIHKYWLHAALLAVAKLK